MVLEVCEDPTELLAYDRKELGECARERGRLPRSSMVGDVQLVLFMADAGKADSRNFLVCKCYPESAPL